MLVLPTSSALDVYKALSFPEGIIHRASAVKIKAQAINFIFKENKKEGSHLYSCTEKTGGRLEAGKTWRQTLRVITSVITLFSRYSRAVFQS